MHEDRLLSPPWWKKSSIINLPLGGWLDLRKHAYGGSALVSAGRSASTQQQQSPQPVPAWKPGTAFTLATVAIAHGHFKQALG